MRTDDSGQGARFPAVTTDASDRVSPIDVPPTLLARADQMIE